MSTLTIGRMTLAEVMKRLDPKGGMTVIAEVLDQVNEMLKDMPWIESNDVWANKTTRRASLPTGTHRRFNKGVNKSRSETVEVVDTIALLEDRLEVDVEMINSFPDPEKARSDELYAFMEGMAQTIQYQILYGDTSVYPEQTNGLARRLDSLGSSLYNVVGAGGSGSDLTSIFVVDWGPNTVYATYPRGSKAGLQRDNMGTQLVTDDGGTNKFRAFVDVMTWKYGLVVRNHRAIGRVCNIETSGSSNNFNEDHLIDLTTRMTQGPGRRMYVNDEHHGANAKEAQGQDQRLVRQGFRPGCRRPGDDLQHDSDPSGGSDPYRPRAQSANKPQHFFDKESNSERTLF